MRDPLGNTGRYAYDAAGQRTTAIDARGDATTYGYDAAGRSPSGGVLEQLTSGGASAALYPLPDALGSVRGLANASGGLVGSSDYDVFGSVRATSGSSSVFGFTGQQTDATSLLCLRARYYNPVLARFVSPDAVFPNATGTQGYSFYDYVTNNPTTLADPSGHEGLVGFSARSVAILIAAAGLAALGAYLLRPVIQAIVSLLAAVATGVEQTIRSWVDQMERPKTVEKPKPKEEWSLAC